MAKKVIVAGGGASGLAAAVTAAEKSQCWNTKTEWAKRS